jgi:hypothetical protein
VRVHFVIIYIGAGYDSIIPDAPGAELHPLTSELAEKTSIRVEQYLDAMEKVKLKQGLKSAMGISSDGNAYLQVIMFPLLSFISLFCSNSYLSLLCYINVGERILETL